MTETDIEAPPYEALAQLTTAMCRALIALSESGWKGGNETELLVGYSYTKESTKWWKPRRKVRTPIYLRTRAVRIDFRLYLTCSGAVYQANLQGSPSGTTSLGPCELIDLQVLRPYEIRYLTDIMNDIWFTRS